MVIVSPAGSAPEAEQGSRSPGRRGAQQQNEKDADEPAGYCALAPALEHGDDSNEEKNDHDGAENLQQHDLRSSRVRLNLDCCSESDLGAVTPVTTVGSCLSDQPCAYLSP